MRVIHFLLCCRGISSRHAAAFLVVVGIWIQAQSALGQWTLNGTKIYYSGGNVGVGTSNPARTLHVFSPTAYEYPLRLESPVTPAIDFVESSFGTIGYIGGGANGFLVGGGPHGLTIRSDGYGIYLGANASNATHMAILPNGSVGIGTSYPEQKLHVSGNVKVEGNIAAKYQDVAEWVPADISMEAGTVVIAAPGEVDHVLPSSKPYDTRVVGVVSAAPGIVLGEDGQGKLRIATVGRVKVKVDVGKIPIEVGDLLVTGSGQGVAMKSEPIKISGRTIHQPGTLIGKALEPLKSGTGQILVLLCLQ